MASSSSHRRRSFVQYLADNNPFYLLSAASMLLACLLLSNTTTWSPIAVRKLVALIVTLNVYELLVIGLGLYLIVRRGLGRDGIMLLSLEAVFLADVGFLNSEVYTESLRTGLVVNGVLLAVAVLKLAAIFRALRMPLRSPAFGLATATMAVLLGHAGLFKWIGDAHQGRLPDGVMYLAWWGLAALVIAYALVTRWTTAVHFRGRRAVAEGGAIGHVLVTLMLASLAGHLGTSHWIYSCPFQAPDVSPVLVALAVLLAGVPETRGVRRGDLALLCFVLPIAAVCTSLHPSGRLASALEPWHVSTAMLTGMAAYLAFVYAFALRQFVRFAAVGVAAGVVYAVAPTWATIQAAIERSYDWLTTFASRLLPRTQGAWGTVAVVGAFVLLAAGAALSLMRQNDDSGRFDGTPRGDAPLPPDDASVPSSDSLPTGSSDTIDTPLDLPGISPEGA